jgi:hypothetical protein
MVHATRQTIGSSDVKVKEVSKVNLEQAMKARGRADVLLYSFFNLGARLGYVINATLRPPYPRKRAPVPIVQETGWAPVPMWKGAENLAPTGIRSPDRPVQPVASRCTEFNHMEIRIAHLGWLLSTSNGTALVYCSAEAVYGKKQY